MTPERRSGAGSAASLAVGAVLAAVLVLAALAGRWAARDSALPRSRTWASEQAPALGPLRIAAPPPWRRLPASAAGFKGIDKLPTQVFDRASGLSSRAVITVASVDSTASPSLIPKPLHDAAARPFGRPRAVRLDGRRAWLYLAVPIRSADETMEITVLPTTAGVVAIACVAPTLAFSGAAGCASALDLTLQRARALRPTADLGFRFRLGAIAGRFDRERVEHRAMLSRARTPRAQARAAHRLAVGHERAARALAPLVGTDTTAEVVASLRDASRRYEDLKRSAAADDRAAFSLAARAIEAADHRLADAWDAAMQPVASAPPASTAS